MVNSNIIKAFYEAIGDGGETENTINQFISPNVTIHIPSSFPWGGVYHGHEGYKKSSSLFMLAWSDLKIHDLQYIGESNRVFVLHRITATSSSTLKTIDAPIAELYTLQSEKIVDIKPFYFDTHAIIKALET